MENQANTVSNNDLGNGMYLKGVVLSAETRVFKKKDGSGYNVLVSHEIAVQPGVVKWEEFHDPSAADSQVVMQGEELITWPRFPDFEPIALKFKGFRVFNNVLTVSKAEVLG